MIEIASPTALQRDGLIVLDLEDQEAAVKMAHKIAGATGRAVTVRDHDMVEIETIPAPKTQ
ncbi:hypothetical protein [Bradyrhizobium sp. LTSP849]|uniref:hypothetical protein n=1 Tax=Bradyrhizobium sp. LTSP849 TaxID=1615890 RepID=UPI0012E0215F|nr:hypothetical protein [Bradyrhizobium sp. LTSP849]